MEYLTRTVFCALLGGLCSPIPETLGAQSTAEAREVAVLESALRDFLVQVPGTLVVSENRSRPGLPSQVLTGIVTPHPPAVIAAWSRAGAERVRVGAVEAHIEGCRGFPDPCRLVGADAALVLSPTAVVGDSAMVGFSIYRRMEERGRAQPNCCVSLGSGFLILHRQRGEWSVSRYVVSVTS
jgi:hypothetical protein